MAEPKFSTWNNAWRSSSTGADIAVASSLAIAAEHFAEQLGIAICKRILHIRRQVIELLGRFVEFVSGAVEFRLRIAKLFGNRAGRTRKRARRIVELGSTRRSSDVASVTELDEVVEMRLHVVVVLVFSVLHLLFCLGDLRIDVVARNLGARNAMFQIARRGAELAREALHGRAHGTQSACHLSKLNRAAIGHAFGERVEGIGQLGVVRRLIGQAIGVRDERLRDGFAAIVRRRERVVYRRPSTPSKLATLASIALASESVEASMAMSAIVVADAFASPTWPATSSA